MGLTENRKRWRHSYRQDHKERGLCIVCTSRAEEWPNGSPKRRCRKCLAKCKVYRDRKKKC